MDKPALFPLHLSNHIKNVDNPAFFSSQTNPRGGFLENIDFMAEILAEPADTKFPYKKIYINQIWYDVILKTQNLSDQICLKIRSFLRQ
jgi:hypothetical protein